MDRAWVPLWGKSEKTEPSPFFLPDWVNFSSEQGQLCEKEGSFFFGNTGYLWTLCMRLGNCLHFHWKCIFVKVLLSSLGALYVIMLHPTAIQPLSNHLTHSIESYNMQRLLFSWIKMTNGYWPWSEQRLTFAFIHQHLLNTQDWPWW